jgi:hypothetical protein
MDLYDIEDKHTDQLQSYDTLPTYLPTYLRAASAESVVTRNKGKTFAYVISFWPFWPHKGGVDINNDVTCDNPFGG